MPYLEGIPCSIHAVVLPDGIAPFRPIEMLVLRRAGCPRFEYAGGVSFWDAPAADAAQMRDVVRRVAAHLPDAVGCRGAFGIDGVLTGEGFRPTELNPRYTGGLSIQAAMLDDEFSPNLLNMIVVEEVPGDYRPALFEEAVLAATAAKRSGWVLMKVPGASPAETRTQPVVFVDGEARPADDPPPWAVWVFCSLDAGAAPAGSPMAPLAVSMLRLAGELWKEVDVVDLEAATGRTPPGT